MINAKPQPSQEDTQSFFRRKWKLLCALAVILLAGAALCANPAYQAAALWRAHSLAAKAMEKLQKQDLPGAVSMVRAASQMKPSDPTVMRAMACVLEKADDPLAIYFRKQLAESPDATLEDRRQYASDLIGKGSVDEHVEEQVKYLLNNEPANSGNWLVAASLYKLCGMNDHALDCARHAHDLDPQSGDATFFLAVQLAENPPFATEGINLLWTISRSKGENSLAATLVLAQQASLTQEEAGLLIDRLKSDPQAGKKFGLLALDLGIKAHPEQRGHLIDAAIQSLPAQDENSLHDMALWLNAHGEQERTLALIPEASMLKSRPLLLAGLDAMATLKRWQEIDTLVSTKAVPLDPAIVELFRGRCAMEMGKMDEATSHWRAAQSATTGNAEEAFYVANYFQQLGRIKQAEAMYRVLIQNPTTSRPAYLALLQMEYTHGDTTAVYNLLREMHDIWGQDANIQNDYAYFSLLLGQNIEQSLAIARDLVKASPDRMAHRTTLALALLKNHDPAAALDVYTGLEINWESQSTSSKLVYAAVLRNNGRGDEASHILSSLKPDDLRPEEKALAQ